MTTAPAQGPSITAASTPPSRCPETPGPTGKFTIWAAKMNAAIMPMSERRPLLELPLHGPQAVAQTHRAHDSRDRRHTGNENGIRNMHASCPEPTLGRSELVTLHVGSMIMAV